MSSKSRQKNQPPRKPGGAPREVEAQKPKPLAADPLDEFIETPKGKSRFQHYFMIFLLVFLLVIFVVPFAVTGALGGSQPGDEVAMTWQHPSKGKQEVTAAELLTEKRAFSEYFNLFGRRVDLDDVETARLIIMDEVAQASGVEISDADLVQQIQGAATQMGGTDAYKSLLQRYTGGVQGFESTMRRINRGNRYLSLLGQMAAVPDPAEIESLWNEEHVEYAFDYVQLAVEDLHDEVRATAPADEELQAYFDGLPEFERNRFLDPERFTAELALYAVGGTAPTALLEAYPEPEDADPDARAEEYYNLVFFTRFLREVDPEDPASGSNRFFTLDEVKEEALAEYPVYFAMRAWASDVATRSEAGEEIDLEAEAVKYGLAYEVQEEALNRQQWQDREPLGGQRLAGAVTRSEAGTLITNLIVEEGGFVIGRVLDKFEAVMPEFADMRERIVDKWVETNAADAALDRLREVRGEMFGESDDEVSTIELADFTYAAESAGLTVARRDWLDRRGPVTDDPNSSEPAHAFLRTQAALYDFEEGQVSEPLLDPRRTHAYLVRSMGSRQVDLAKMNPQQFTTYRTRTSQTARTNLVGDGPTGLGGREELERLYDLQLPLLDAALLEQEDEIPN